VCHIFCCGMMVRNTATLQSIGVTISRHLVAFVQHCIAVACNLARWDRIVGGQPAALRSMLEPVCSMASFRCTQRGGQRTRSRAMHMAYS
jgi:hypothetical protein